MLLLARAAAGADWLTEPSIAFSSEYNDNTFLTTLPHDTLLRNSVRPALQVKGATETASLQTDAWLRFDRYPGEPSINSNNWDLKLDSAFGSEVQHADVLVDFMKDTTLETELLDTGLTGTATPRRSALIAPSWNYSMNQTTFLGLDYSYSKVNYEASTVLIDYRYQTVSGSLAWQFSDATEWSVVAFGDNYDTADDVSRFWNVGVQGGVVHDFSERVHTRFFAGARHTTSRNEFLSNVYRDNSTGGVLDARLEYQFERARLYVDVSSNVQPSGGGYLQESDLINLGWWHPVAPQWRVSVDATAIHNQSLTDYRTPYDRHYATVQARLDWRWARKWLAGGYVRYARSKYVQNPDVADANVVGVQVTYRWSGADL